LKPRLIIFLIIACFIISAFFTITDILSINNQRPDTIEINRIRLAVEASNPETDFFYDFTVIDLAGNLLFSTKAETTLSFQERINQAILNYDTVIDFSDGNVSGKIIIYTGVLLQGNRPLRLFMTVIPFLIIALLLIIYYFYLQVYLYYPFKRLKKFAQDIASGNLDIALPMDKGKHFGEFTESFDMMREELKAAHQKAILEEISKKELIAALSHDIKTPISIVRAASELLELGEVDEKRLKNIKTIQIKTLEIDTLITDLFSSALEDLVELKVKITDIEAKQVEKLLVDADPLNKIIIKEKMPECLVRIDPVRLAQVFGNILSNSYKYANTEIEVRYQLSEKFLKIILKDFGTNLNKEDLPLIKNKFYRGSNASNQQGAGLGLYICAQLLDKMAGFLDFDLVEDGFLTYINIALS